MSKYQEIKEKAIQYAEENHTDKTVIMAVAAAMNAKLDYNKLEAGEGRMCTVFDEIEKEGEVKGRAFSIIEICLEFGISESDILSRLQKKLEVSLEEAQDYFAKYKKKRSS